MRTKQGAGFTLLEIMIVVAIIGLLAAMVMPNMRRAMDTARQRACSINRKNIDGAKLQWSVENNKPTTSVPTDTDLFGAGAYIEHKPDCPAGGSYSINAVAEKCTCTVPVHSN